MDRAIKLIYRDTGNVASRWKNDRRVVKRRRLKQGCPVSSALFSLYIVDIKEYMKIGQNGGAVVGREKPVMLAYANDLALVARTEE